MCCCSVAKSCPTLCDPVDCSMPHSSVLHPLPEISQTHVYCQWCSLTISSSAASFSFFNGSTLHIRWPKYQSFSFSVWRWNMIHKVEILYSRGKLRGSWATAPVSESCLWSRDSVLRQLGPWLCPHPSSTTVVQEIDLGVRKAVRSQSWVTFRSRGQAEFGTEERRSLGKRVLLKVMEIMVVNIKRRLGATWEQHANL